jgi:hypothetical protein
LERCLAKFREALPIVGVDEAAAELNASRPLGGRDRREAVDRLCEGLRALTAWPVNRPGIDSTRMEGMVRARALSLEWAGEVPLSVAHREGPQ